MWGVTKGFDYVGSNIPATGADVGQLIQVDNPAVPGGLSIREWNGLAWSWPIGEPVASIADPFSVVSAASTAVVDYLLCTLPANTIRSGEVWELFSPHETAAGNTGNDACGLVLSGALIDAATAPANSNSQFRCGIARNGSLTRKVVCSATSGLRTTLYSSTLVDYSQPIDVKIRLTPATVGNSSYIRHASFRRVA